ncbi:electron transport complex subunit RsxG [Allohahella marinimesophila]|uniref:Ion-translocating oxidoreductase complex subunit G n=2 Tax=Allohahella marinimesophila TaxID=1054972 RepID=A0ABP7Q5X3_9GAMM
MRFPQSPAVTLALFAAVSAALVTAVYLLTRAPIQAAEARWFQQRLSAVLQPATGLEPVDYEDIVQLPDRQRCPQCWQNSELIDPAHAIHLNSQSAGAPVFAIPTFSSRGYNGRIDVITGVAIVREQQSPAIVAVQVSRHRETPGIGDRIEADKSAWLENFRGKATVNDIDALSGATISASAVEDAVEKALRFARQNRDQLMSHTGS